MVNQSTVLLMFAIGSIIVVLSLLILFHQNANATKGYHLRTLERERSRLLLQEEVLKMELAKEQALQALQQNPQIEAMVEPRDVEYGALPLPLATADARL